MKYTCKNCKSVFNIKVELLKCIKCDKSICSECGIKQFSNVYNSDSYYVCEECYNLNNKELVDSD